VAFDVTARKLTVRACRRASSSSTTSRVDGDRRAAVSLAGSRDHRERPRDDRRLRDLPRWAAHGRTARARYTDDVFRAHGGLAWVGLYRPSQQEFAAVAAEFGLHELAAEDAVHPHQRPRLERYGDTLFCVLRTARYVDETETVEFSEVHVFAGPRFVVTVRHGEAPDIAAVRRALESRPDLLRRGPVAILHAIMDRVLDGYAPVVAGVENDIDEIEDEVFNGSAGAPRRVYELSCEVIAFQRATKPLPPMLERLIDDPSLDENERRYLRDVQDHALRVVEQADGFRQLLQNILSVNLTGSTERRRPADEALGGRSR
jgi:magnesium transporter